MYQTTGHRSGPSQCAPIRASRGGITSTPDFSDLVPFLKDGCPFPAPGRILEQCRWENGLLCSKSLSSRHASLTNRHHNPAMAYHGLLNSEFFARVHPVWFEIAEIETRAIRVPHRARAMILPATGNKGSKTDSSLSLRRLIFGSEVRAFCRKMLG